MLRRWFGRDKQEKLRDGEVRIVLPEESYTLCEWQQDDLPCIGMLNSGLSDFGHKEIFGWHLSVIIDFDELVDNEGRRVRLPAGSPFALALLHLYRDCPERPMIEVMHPWRE